MSVISLWWFLGSINLLISTIGDIKNKEPVYNDKRSYIMLGLTLSFLAVMDRSISYILLGVLLLIAFSFFWRHFKQPGYYYLGLGFAVYGFWLLQWDMLVSYLVIVIGMLLLFYAIGLIFKLKYKKMPYFYASWVGFVITGIIYGLLGA